jgi:GTPase
MDHDQEQLRSGMVAIVGPPNAGKSTLLNQLLGQKISIVTPKPQTTRNRIVGILNGEGHQIIFLDTPGLHAAKEPLNQEMVRVALASLTDVDAVLFLLDAAQAARGGKEFDGELHGYFQQLRGPAILVLNKIDLLDRRQLLPVIDRLTRLHPFQTVVPVSALKGDGLAAVVAELLALLPFGPRYFPEDFPTDSSERFLCAEIVREKVFLLTGQEIPYATAVLIESFKEEPERGLITIHAAIVLEKESQKGILIGKGGSKLKSIGTAARRDMEKLLANKVLLKLWVKVRKNWSQDGRFLKEIGM